MVITGSVVGTGDGGLGAAVHEDMKGLGPVPCQAGTEGYAEATGTEGTEG